MNISLAAEPIFHIGSFTVTNTLLMSWATVIFVLILGLVLNRKKLVQVPRGFQNFIETVFESLLNLIESVTQDRKQAIKFFPIVTTIFIFVILSNWIEILPGLGTIGIFEVHHGQTVLVPFIRATSSDLNFTLAIALVSVFATQFMGIAAIGFVKNLRRFFHNPLDHPAGWLVGIPVGFLEVISELAKIISFSFRLFGNIFAGEVLLLVVTTLVPYIVPLPFLFLEIFVGFVQALVFAMLTLVFLKMATVEVAH